MGTTDVAARPLERRTTAARIIRITGNTLLVLGAIALAWAFVVWKWGDPATGLYTRWQQQRLESGLAALEQRYGEGRPSAGKPHAPTATPVPSPSPAALRADAKQAAGRLAATARAGDPVGRISVPRLGLDMIFVEGTDEGSLKRGPGVDQRTNLPGRGQLVYIAGHRTTFGAPFAHIERMRKGDLIELDMPYGRYVYRVTEWVIVPSTDLSRLRSRGREEVALQACHPRFSAHQRYIVYGRPIAGPGIRPAG